MSYTYSPELVAAYLQANSSDTVPSVPLKSTPTPDQYYWPDKPMEHSQLSRYGITSAPLTGVRGEALLTWFVEASRAKTSALPDAERESPGREVGYGASLPASLAKFDPASSSWKTAQLSLLEDSESSSVIWPRSGMTHDGECWELPTLERITSEIESGYLPTPVATDAGSGRFNTSTSAGSTPRPTLALMARKNLWPTPQASDNRDRGNLSTPAIKRRVEIGKQVSLSMCVSSQNGRLNPDWVEWLMGWPIGHTDLKPLETAKFQEWQKQHSPCF